MSTAPARIVAIHPEIGSDGSRDVDVAFSDGSFIRATISADRVGPLASALQQGLLNGRPAGVPAPHIPLLTVADFYLAHGQSTTELTAHTAEIGSLVLQVETEQLEKLRSEIDRLLEMRSLPRGRN